MSLRALTFISLLLAALGLGPGITHLLEMPVKLGYSPQRYFEVTSTLYAWFGTVGAVVQVSAVVVAGTLAYACRGRPGFGSVVLGGSLLAASIVAWAILVAPVNAAWSESIESASESLPAVYAHHRLRWEYGHVVAFVSWLAGYCALQWFAVGPHSRAGRRGIT
jgi:hypothetical protein